MKKLPLKDQQALTALLTQLDQSANTKKFNPMAHASLLATPAVALQLIRLLLASSGTLTPQQQENRGMLLQFSLKLSLSDDQRSPVTAIAFQQDIEQLFSQYLAEQQTVDFPVLRAVLNILFRVNILLSDELVDAINQAEYPYPDDAAALSEETLHQLLADIADECKDDSLYELTEFLFEQFSQLPPAAAPMIATMLLQASDEKLRSCATLFLLHPHPLFRQALLHKLPELAEKKLLGATDLQRLVWLRNWLKKDAHPTLDRCIKLLQRQQLPVVRPAVDSSIAAVFATPFDNSGAMMLMVELKQEKHFLLFSFMLKQGQGVQDAFITPPLTRRRLNAMTADIRGEMPVAAIDHQVMAALLEHFLLQSREHSRLPLPLLLFRELTAGVWGSPHAIDVAQVKAAVQGQKNRNNKLDLVEFLAGWAKPSTQANQTIEQYIQSQMEPERASWRERLLLTALVFAQTANDMPLLVDAVLAIDAGLPLVAIDEMNVIAMHALDEFTQPHQLLQQLFGQDEPVADRQMEENAADLAELADIFGIETAELDTSQRPTRAVYQLKIQLKGSKPLISRTIQLMNTLKLDRVHEVLQVAMGWEHEHSYEFNNTALSFVPPWFEMTDGSFHSHQGQLRDLLKNQGDKLTYIYDFGDWWEHQVTLEKVLPASRSNTPPQLLKAKGACPPENCGGVGYYNGLRAVFSDPSHPEHKKRCREYGIKPAKWQPDLVDVAAINQLLAAD